MADPFTPSATLLIKLGSIIVHFEELITPTGHGYDKVALDSLLSDPEVVEWMEQMNAMAMLPVKRDG